MTNDGNTRPDDATRSEEAVDAKVHGGADRMPTADEAEAAAHAGKESADVDESYREATERGARQKGEGRLP